MCSALQRTPLSTSSVPPTRRGAGAVQAAAPPLLLVRLLLLPHSERAGGGAGAQRRRRRTGRVGRRRPHIRIVRLLRLLLLGGPGAGGALVRAVQLRDVKGAGVDVEGGCGAGVLAAPRRGRALRWDLLGQKVALRQRVCNARTNSNRHPAPRPPTWAGASCAQAARRAPSCSSAATSSCSSRSDPRSCAHASAWPRSAAAAAALRSAASTAA